jgi:hypothetical protein
MEPTGGQESPINPGGGAAVRSGGCTTNGAPCVQVPASDCKSKKFYWRLITPTANSGGFSARSAPAVHTCTLCLQGTWLDVQVEVDVRRHYHGTGLSSSYQGGGSSGSADPQDFPEFVLCAWDERVTEWLKRVHAQPTDRDLNLSASWRKD